MAAAVQHLAVGRSSALCCEFVFAERGADGSHDCVASCPQFRRVFAVSVHPLSCVVRRCRRLRCRNTGFRYDIVDTLSVMFTNKCVGFCWSLQWFMDYGGIWLGAYILLLAFGVSIESM